MPEISVIIPAYNAAETLGIAINSVLCQSFRDFEVIVVNDGSTDSTQELVETFAREDNRIKIISKRNGGQASARNGGLAEAIGKWILFLDADDSYVDGAFDKLMGVVADSELMPPDIVLFGFNIFSKNKLLRTPNAGDRVVAIKDGLEDFDKIEYLLASACNKMYRKSYITTVFDETVVHGEDSRFNYLNLKKNTVIRAISNCLYNVCLDTEGSVNKRYIRGKIRDFCANAELKVMVIDKLFNSSSAQDKVLKNKYIRKGIDTISYQLVKGASHFSRKEYLEEIKDSADRISILGSYNRARTIYRIPWFLFNKGYFKSLYLYSITYFKVLDLVKWLLHRK